MNERCWMIKEGPVGGGGNLRSNGCFVVRRTAAIGDVLASTVVADKLIAQGFPVSMQSHPNTHCVLRRHGKLAGITEPNGFCHINLDGAYEFDPARRKKTFARMFIDRANQQMLNIGMNLGEPVNCKPRIYVDKRQQEQSHDLFKHFARPWIFICPRSDAYKVRTVQDGVWQAALQGLPGTHFWIGRHPAPSGVVDLHAQHLDDVIGWLSVADLLVSVDTGPMHIAAALNKPVIAINQSSSPHLHLNDQNDFTEVSPTGLECLNCQTNVCPKDSWNPPCSNLDPQLIHEAVAARAAAIGKGKTSALIPTFNADSARLNQVVELLLPQVEEVVITAAADAKVPDGINLGPKVRIVRSPQARLGFGKNVNFGFRHTLHDFVLCLNDDCFLEQDVVQKLKAICDTGVGAVSHLLRYPDRTIYYGGKYREPGGMGWGHVAHRKFENEYQGVTEQEVLCGCSVLYRRSAFYEVGGFDERFHMYSEDDDLCMRLRKAKFKLLYHPHACGIHNEGQSCRDMGQKIEWIKHSNGLMGTLWKDYWQHNARGGIGNFDY